MTLIAGRGQVWLGRPPRKLEDTSLERPIRRMLEKLSREYSFNWKSGDGRCDFWIYDTVIEVQGPFHDDAYPTQQRHDEYKRGLLIDNGFPKPIYLYGEAIKKNPKAVYQMLEALVIHLGGTRK